MQITHRRLADRYPLRVTIVVVLLALVVVALGASGVVATTIMRGYLLDRVDEQLQQTRRTAVACLAGSASAGLLVRGQPAGSCRASSSSSSATPWAPSDDGPVGSRLATPSRCRSCRTLNLNQVRLLEGRPFNVDAVSGAHLACPRGADGRWPSSVMVAQSLKDMDHTIQRLVGIQAAAGLILLVLLAGRRDLRRTAKSAADWRTSSTPRSRSPAVI